MRPLFPRLRNRLRFEFGRIDLRVSCAIWKLPSITLEELAPQKDPLPPPILDDIGFPPHNGMPDHDDYEPLMRIVQKVQPKIVLELGTAHGNAVANICRLCPEAQVYTVNALPEAQTGLIDTFKVAKEEIGRVYRQYGYQARVVQIFENTLKLDLSDYFSGPVIDLAIIDACHDTEYVINDFSRVHPFLRPGGIILFHDTHPSMQDHLRGSYLGCVALRRQGYDIRHLAGTWWGVWEKK